MVRRYYGIMYITIKIHSSKSYIYLKDDLDLLVGEGTHGIHTLLDMILNLLSEIRIGSLIHYKRRGRNRSCPHGKVRNIIVPKHIWQLIGANQRPQQ